MQKSPVDGHLTSECLTRRYPFSHLTCFPKLSHSQYLAFVSRYHYHTISFRITWLNNFQHMEVSWNRGNPQIPNHPFLCDFPWNIPTILGDGEWKPPFHDHAHHPAAKGRRLSGEQRLAPAAVQWLSLNIWGGSIHGGTQNGWFTRENPSTWDDLGLPPFMETTIWWNPILNSFKFNIQTVCCSGIYATTPSKMQNMITKRQILACPIFRHTPSATDWCGLPKSLKPVAWWIGSDVCTILTRFAS